MFVAVGSGGDVDGAVDHYQQLYEHGGVGRDEEGTGDVERGPWVKKTF